MYISSYFNQEVNENCEAGKDIFFAFDFLTRKLWWHILFRCYVVVIHLLLPYLCLYHFNFVLYFKKEIVVTLIQENYKKKDSSNKINLDKKDEMRRKKKTRTLCDMKRNEMNKIEKTHWWHIGELCKFDQDDFHLSILIYTLFASSIYFLCFI